MNLWNKLKAIYTGKLPPEPVVEAPPKAPPAPRKPSVRRLELNKRAEATGHHLALQKGSWQLCRIGPDSATHVTWHPDLDDVEAKLVELEAAK